MCQLSYRATVAVWYPNLAPSTSILWVAQDDRSAGVRGLMAALKGHASCLCCVDFNSRRPGLNEEINAWFEVPKVPVFPPSSQQQDW